MRPLPKIALTASDYPRLEQIARVAAQQGDIGGIILRREIDRASIIPDEANEVHSLVTVGSWVTYWTNWGMPPRTAQLVWPDEASSEADHISVLAPTGAALIGLREGDQMPYFVGGCLNLVTVQQVSRWGPKVRPMFPNGTAGRDEPNDDDPGPNAA